MPTHEEVETAIAMGRAMSDAITYINIASQYEMDAPGSDLPSEDQLLAHADAIISQGFDHVAMVIHCLSQMIMATGAEERVQAYCNVVNEQIREVLAGPG